MMQAGRLNTRCVIQRRTGGTNDWGEPLPEGWETHATVWANVKHLAIRGGFFVAWRMQGAPQTGSLRRAFFVSIKKGPHHGSHTYRHDSQRRHRPLHRKDDHRYQQCCRSCRCLDRARLKQRRHCCRVLCMGRLNFRAFRIKSITTDAFTL